MNNRYIAAVEGRNLSGPPPIWLMRQAGRYHRHYQALRAKHSFMQLCKEPELAAQVALGPVQDFDFDVAILFSDLLFPLEALGMGLEYGDQGPELGWHLNEDNIKNLRPADEAIEGLKFQKVAMRSTREMLTREKSLVGFVGGPWTLFVYACEGSHSGNLLETKKRLHLFPKFLDIMTPLLQKNIALQIEGGAEIVYIFDTAAGEISPALYRRMIEPALLKLADSFPKRTAYYSKGTQPEYFSEQFLNSSFAGFGFDHRWNLSSWLQQKKSSGLVQGNFDQALLHAHESDFKRELDEFLKPFKDLPRAELSRWVCGLGHGVLPMTPENHVRYFVDHVRKTFA